MSDNGNIASPELRNDDVLLDVQHLTKTSSPPSVNVLAICSFNISSTA